MKNIIRLSILSCLMVAFAFAGITVYAAEKPESITMMVDGTWLAPDNGEEIPEGAYEKLTGVDLILNHPVHNEYYPKLDLAFTTGDIPDVFVVGALQYVRYAGAGALYDMTEMYENSKMKAHMNNALVEASRIDGKLYGIPYQRGNGTLLYVRGDWLEKLGLEAPKDYAEFLDMLRAFKNNNPDGLAPDEVIPLTAPGLANSEYPMDIYLPEFYQGATPDYVKTDAGEWVDGMLQPNMVDALTRLRDAYAEGLIDTEIVTNKTSDCRNKFYSGVVGAFNYWAGYWNDRLQINTVVNVPDANVIGIPALKESFYIERPPGIMAMYAGVKNPQGIFDNFLELLNDSGEGLTAFTFGIEGESYEVVDGVIQFLPTKLNPDTVYNKVFIDPSLVATTDFTPEFVRDPLTGPSYDTFRGSNVQYDLPNASEKLGELQKEINAIKVNYISKIVFGDFTIEEGLEKYAKEVEKYNEAVLADMNK